MTQELTVPYVRTCFFFHNVGKNIHVITVGYIVHTHTHTERERERERESLGEEIPSWKKG